MSQAGGTDERLMQQVAAGDRAQMAPLVRRYASPLLTYIQRMIGDRHRSEELFQEVFMAVWRKRRTYKTNRAFRPWLFAIATNQCRADFRSAAKRQQTASYGGAGKADTVATDGNPGPADTLLQTETQQLVLAAVERLPDQQRSVVVLRVFNGLTFAEISQAVGCAEPTARSYMHHALASMRRYLEPKLRD